jgi:membrane-associated PAP2 superfamily phosphatase
MTRELPNKIWHKIILANILLIILLLVFFQKSNMDVALQNFLFDSSTKKWLINRDQYLGKLIFYQLPKLALGTW